MLNKFLSIFSSKKPEPAAPPAPAPVPAAETSAAPPDELAIWLESNDERNPFGIAGYDCSPFTQTMTSTTGDQRIAEQFLELRASMGQELIGAMPEDAVEIACRLVYPDPGKIAEGPIFRSNQMEEKWDIFLHQGHIYFRRSWTGKLVFVAETIFADGEFRVAKFYAPAGMVCGDEAHLIRQVNYLIQSHLFSLIEPHPLPKDTFTTPTEIAAYSFNQYGNRCMFGTYEETLGYMRPSR